MTSFVTWLGVCLAGVAVYLIQRILKRNPAPFPPGPTPLPIVGNLFDLPTAKPWLTYVDWGKKFGTVLQHAEISWYRGGS